MSDLKWSVICIHLSSLCRISSMRQSSQKLKNQLQVRTSRHWPARAFFADPAIGYRLPPFNPIAPLRLWWGELPKLSMCILLWSFRSLNCGCSCWCFWNYMQRAQFLHGALRLLAGWAEKFSRNGGDTLNFAGLCLRLVFGHCVSNVASNHLTLCLKIRFNAKPQWQRQSLLPFFARKVLRSKKLWSNRLRSLEPHIFGGSVVHIWS